MSERLRALQARSQRIAVMQPVYRLCCAAWVRIWHTLTVRTLPTLTSGYRVTFTVEPLPDHFIVSSDQCCSFWLRSLGVRDAAASRVEWS